MAEAEWKVDVKIKPGSDLHKQLTHLPEVVAQLTQMAATIATKAGQGHKAGRYGILVQNKRNTKRARVLVHPLDSGGIHLELTQHLMLKAAASTGGGHKEITTKPTGPAMALGSKPTDSGAAVVNGVITPTPAIAP